MASHIEEITLSGLLPLVFAQEEIPMSGIWRGKATFRRGGRYLVEAASGAGKSSLAAYLIGSRRDFEGTIAFDGRDSRSLSITDWQSLRRENIAYLPQELALFPEMTAIDNILLKAELGGTPDHERIDAWMRRLGVDSRRDYPAGRLSIGQQQRIALIRTLCQPFDFLLLDEPVSHLDETNNRIASAIVEEEASRQGAAVISFSVGNPLMLDYNINLHL